MELICKHCGKPYPDEIVALVVKEANRVSAMRGSEKLKEAARQNGKLGGRPVSKGSTLAKR